MGAAIGSKVMKHERGLYLYLLFPIAVSFLLTFAGCRLISNLDPNLYLAWSDIHIHHFTYGFFILAASGYLAMVFDGPRAKYLIALLHGFGLGLSFDEFAMWLTLSDDDPARWSYDGFIIITGLIIFIMTARPGFKMLKEHFPFLGDAKDTKIFQKEKVDFSS